VPGKKGAGARAARPTNAHDVDLARVAEKGRRVRLELWVSLARSAIKAIGWAFAAWCMYMSIRAVAGTSTAFLAIVEGGLKMSLDRYAAYALAAVSGMGWFGERKLRQRTIKQHAEYIRKLESDKDPKRSTSGLTATGKPRARIVLDADESGETLAHEERKEGRHER
jgi:hypothetical protein